MLGESTGPVRPSASPFAVSYTPTWGRVGTRMIPVAGNHEYRTVIDQFRDAWGLGTNQNSAYRPWWKVRYAAGADIVLNGHVHNYQRFAPMNPSGVVDPLWIRWVSLSTSQERGQDTGIDLRIGCSSTPGVCPRVRVRPLHLARVRMGRGLRRLVRQRSRHVNRHLSLTDNPYRCRRSLTRRSVLAWP